MKLDQSINDQIASTEDHMAIFDKFAAAALAGLLASEEGVPSGGVVDLAMEMALDMMRIRHCCREKIKLANRGITPKE